MTTANKITIIRVLLIPVFMAVLMLRREWTWLWAMGIFVVAGVTDGIDGYIARKYNQVTNMGKLLDPLADKLLVMAALLIFLAWDQIPIWAVTVILAREFAVTGLRLVAASQGKVIAAALSGKIKTFSEIVCICIMLTPLAGIVIAGGVDLNDLCVWIMTLTTVWSGAEYFIKNSKALVGDQ